MHGHRLKTAKILLSASIVFLLFADAVPALGGDWFAVKPAGHLFVIEGKFYCWRSEASKRLWIDPLPQPAESLKAKVVRIDLDLEKEQLTVATITFPPRGRRNSESMNDAKEPKTYLSLNEKGEPIAVEKPDERLRWIIRKDPSGWREAKSDPDDKIHLYAIRNPSGIEEKRWLGLAEKPEIFEDKNGDKLELYPLVLTDEEHSLRLVYNDFSGK